MLAFSADQRLWYERSPYVVSVSADEAGRFVMPPMPAADYHVVAFDAAEIDVPTGEQLEPELLRVLALDTARVSVRDGARQQIAVSVSPAGR